LDDKIKFQSVKLQPSHKFVFNINDHFPLIGFAQFDVVQLILKIGDFQSNNPEYQTMSFPDVSKPEDFNSLTEVQMKYVEDFLC